MNDDALGRFFFDYVDPLSYLVELELREAEARLGTRVERIPFELRPPPAQMVDPASEEWLTRWRTARGHAQPLGIQLEPWPLVPWTRKAHEFVLHAAEHESGPAAHALLFEHAVREGADIGRIDVLVRLGVELGLDATETKAVLDVDRYAASVVRARTKATASGVVTAATLARAGAMLEGFRNAAEIVKFFSPT